MATLDSEDQKLGMDSADVMANLNDTTCCQQPIPPHQPQHFSSDPQTMTQAMSEEYYEGGLGI